MTDSLWRKRQEPERSMKVEGPLHVVCQCDQCKTQLEPVAWVEQIMSAFPLFDDKGLDEEKHHCEWTLQQDRKRLHAMLKTTPPQRTWVGLDLEEASAMWDRAEKRQAYQGVPALTALIQEVEAKLKEKNT